MLPVFERATAEFKETHSVERCRAALKRGSMKQGLAVLIYFYLGTLRKLLTMTLKAGRSVTDIRDGIELPLAHIHPSRPMSKCYCILLVQPLANESIRSHPTAQKTCIKRHSSLILYPLYFESLKWEWPFTFLFSCSNRAALPSSAARGTHPPPRGHWISQLWGKNCCPCCRQSKDSCSWAARTCGSQGSPGFSGEQHWQAGPVHRGQPGWQPASVGVHPEGQLWACCWQEACSSGCHSAPFQFSPQRVWFY